MVALEVSPLAVYAAEFPAVARLILVLGKDPKRLMSLESFARFFYRKHVILSAWPAIYIKRV
jgi:hypothetical protein